ncbi:hypothetical protein H4J02_09595 [Protaetiibacter sp. SSC-01]|uniref:hypothetical protein n=1 Tax=Protaetiibacter sp. SSC-01 TaxID=2759943 RepID=UPI001656C3A1|nr:hypothetical protein [Protaetiibacter sp. SSC-01]QNO36740.1 hypothetical protein H4J02_09595 [Protaetiibacter sp. SSC-01]
MWLATSGGTPSADPTETASVSPSPSETPSETPSEDPTPSETPSEEPPPPPPPADAISSFTASAQDVDCSGGVPVPVTFSWTTSGTTVWFGVGTDDARAAPYESGLQPNDTIGIDYQCGQPDGQQRYTITVQRTDGAFESETVVIRES